MQAVSKFKLTEILWSTRRHNFSLLLTSSSQPQLFNSAISRSWTTGAASSIQQNKSQENRLLSTKISRTDVLPWKIIGSCSGPSQYAKVQMACADLSSNAASSLWRPSEPSSLRNHFLDVVSVLACRRAVLASEFGVGWSWKVSRFNLTVVEGIEFVILRWAGSDVCARQRFRLLVLVLRGWVGWPSSTYIYGPGNSLNALKERQVSSTSTGPPTCLWQVVSTFDTLRANSFLPSCHLNYRIWWFPSPHSWFILMSTDYIVDLSLRPRTTYIMRIIVIAICTTVWMTVVITVAITIQHTHSPF